MKFHHRQIPSARRVLSALGVAAAFLLPLSLAEEASAQGSVARSAQLYEDALKRVEKQDLPGAIVQLRNALQQDRTNLAAQLLLGRILLASDQPKAAEATLEEALRQGIAPAEVFPLLGQVYLRVGEPQKLLETLQLRQGSPEVRAEVAMLRGAAHAMRGAVSSAMAEFATAKQLDPRSAKPWVAEVPLLLRSGDIAGAQAAATRATELAPDDAQTWQQLGVVQQAQGLMQRALESQERALKLEPKLVDALVARAGLLLGLNRQSEARAMLAQMKTDKVRDPRAALMRALLAEEAGRSAEAREEYVETSELVDALPAAARAQNDASLVAGAMAHRALGNRERAREYLETLLARNGRHQPGRLMLAEMLLEDRQANRAASLAESVVREDPLNAQALNLLGRTHLARRQYDQAAELFDRALRAGGGAQAQRDLAMAQVGSNQFRQAEANLEKVFRQNPADLRAGIELAILHARGGNRQRALQVAEAVVARDPRNPSMLNFLGNIKGRLGDNDGLRKAYEQALAIDPNYRQVLINLSQLDIEQGRFEPARKRLAGLLTKDAGDTEALFLAGQLEQRARRPEQAEALWRRADGTQTRDPRAGVALVDLKLSQRKPADALEVARSLASRFPEAVVVLHTLARAQLAAQQASAARTTLQDAARFAGFDTDSLVATAKMQMAADDASGASQSLRKALQARPTDLGALVTQVELAARGGQPSAVDEAMRALNRHHAGQVPALVTAGHVAMSRRQLAQAVASYQAAYDKEPGSHTALPLAQAHLASNRPAEALALMSALVKRVPDDVVALRSLAELQLMQSRLPDARQSVARLAELRPDDAETLIMNARVSAGWITAEDLAQLRADAAADELNEEEDVVAE